MYRNLVILGAVIGITAGFLTTPHDDVEAQSVSVTPSGPAIGITPQPVNTWNREPTVVWDSSGSTLLGSIHLRVSIYSDGLVTASKFFPTLPGPIQPVCVEKAKTKTIPVAQVRMFHQTLLAAGANTLNDNPLVVTDVPLQTMTFFRHPGPNARSHTFNYWATNGAWGNVDALIRQFIMTEFPNL